MATLDSTATIAEVPIEQEPQDKGVAMSAITNSPNNVNVGSSSGNNQTSPRNTLTPSSMMAGTFVHLGSVEVPRPLQDGEKFVKWDEVSHFFI